MDEPRLLETPETKVEAMMSICRQTAKIFADKDWEVLTYSERLVVVMLERREFLTPRKNGRVGKAVVESFSIPHHLTIDFSDRPQTGRQCA